MPINFPNLVSTVAAGFQLGKVAYDWLTDATLKDDFKRYLSDLETRRVLYVKWQYEDIHGVLQSLSEILEKTRNFKANHHSNPQVKQLLNKLIIVIQEESDVIRGCNMHSIQGEYMAYLSLLKIRSEMARVLAIFCGMLRVSPSDTELEQFIMNMALVRPNA